MAEAVTRSKRIAASWGQACLIGLVAAVMIAANADWDPNPRFDGAGYAVLGRALAEGKGYRAIDHPDQPRHGHFPPGYPILLALTWKTVGFSVFGAHLLSGICTLGATLAAWWWFRLIFPRRVALLLGLGLAVNWNWTRTGTGIQSEPFFELLSQLTILAAARTGRANGIGRGFLLGGLAAACLLTRQIALGLMAALLLELILSRRWSVALAAVSSVVVMTSPWLGWLAIVGSNSPTQMALLTQANSGLLERFVTLLVFYIQRIPDQITGPFVEVATSIRPSLSIVLLANVWAVLTSSSIVTGWAFAVGRPRRRLAGLIPLSTLVLLLVWPYTEAGRFLIPLIPCLLIGGVEGFSRLAGAGARFLRLEVSRPHLQWWAAGLILAVSLPYSGYAAATGRSRLRQFAHRDFDAACRWITQHGDRPGPILTRHPGEVFWQTGRQALEVSTSERPGFPDADPAAVARTIQAYGVAYILIDDQRYANAPTSPMARFVAQFPDRVREVWGSRTQGGSVRLYEVVP